MKKIYAFILVLCLCATMCACNKNQDDEQPQLPEMKTEIVGEWKALGADASADFNADGSGTLSEDGDREITWKYDPDSDCYVVTDTVEKNATFRMENDMEFLSIGNTEYCRAKDHQKGMQWLQKKRMDDIQNYTSAMNKVKLNTAYQITENVFITFTEISNMDNEGILTAKYSATNYRQDPIVEPLCAQMSVRCYVDGNPSVCTLIDTMQLDFPIEPRETLEGSVILFDFNMVQQADNDEYGNVIGAVCLNMYGSQYYFDLSEYYA